MPGRIVLSQPIAVCAAIKHKLRISAIKYREKQTGFSFSLSLSLSLWQFGADFRSGSIVPMALHPSTCGAHSMHILTS